MEENRVENVPTFDTNIKCLICSSREVVKVNKATTEEQIKLFEQLIEQKTDEKLKIDNVGFCKGCSANLDSYKKLKSSCIRAWKNFREKSNLVPVIVTPELKLFRIDDAGPPGFRTQKSSIQKVIQVMKNPQPKLIQQDTTLSNRPIKIKSSVKYSPYPMKQPAVPPPPLPRIELASPSQIFIQKNFCYICKCVRSNLTKHLVIAHAIIGKNSQMTCNDCGLVCIDEKGFLRHFEHNHRPMLRPETRRVVKKVVPKRPAVPSNIFKLEKIVNSIPKSVQKVGSKVDVTDKQAT